MGEQHFGGVHWIEHRTQRLAVMPDAGGGVVAWQWVRDGRPFVALGVVFIALGAEFVGFAQLLVYVGAVAMLMVFAILLTEPERLVGARTRTSFAGPVAGAVIALATLAALLAFIFSSPLAATPMPSGEHAAPVAAIGRELMGTYVVALLALGVLLTAALVGAAVIAMEDKEP